MSFDAAQFFPILPDQVRAAWPHLLPFLEEYEERTRFTTPQDVLEQALRGEMQLWTYHDGDYRFRGVLGTRIHQTPAGPVCALWLTLGHNAMELIQDAYQVIERWARANGCYAMEIVGRRGWKRVLPDFEEESVVLRKVLVEKH